MGVCRGVGLCGRNAACGAVRMLGVWAWLCGLGAWESVSECAVCVHIHSGV